MKNEFLEKLQEDENLLFYGVADVSRTSKHFGRFILGFIVLTIFWILIIASMRNMGGLSFDRIIIMLVLGIITLLLFYGLIHNICLKFKNSNNEYFVTNKRIAKYNLKAGFRIENIDNIEHIGIAREKNNYGDIMFNFYNNNLLEQMKNGMTFEGTENPREIIRLITSINKNVHVYDDRPTILGKRI